MKRLSLGLLLLPVPRYSEKLCFAQIRSIKSSQSQVQPKGDDTGFRIEFSAL